MAEGAQVATSALAWERGGSNALQSASRTVPQLIHQPIRTVGTAAGAVDELDAVRSLDKVFEVDLVIQGGKRCVVVCGAEWCGVVTERVRRGGVAKGSAAIPRFVKVFKLRTGMA